MKRVGLIIFFSFSLKISFAQKDTHFKMGLTYLNDYVFYGRTDSIRYPYLSPYLEYSFKDFTIGGDINFLVQKNDRRLDFSEVYLMYNHDFNDQFTAGFNYYKYFNGNQRASLNGDIGSSLGLSAAYDFHFVSLSSEIGLFFSDQSDVYTTIEINKELNIPSGNATWNINPTLDLNFSTLRYYESTITRKSQRRLPPFQSFPVISSTKVVRPGFQMMDIEFSVPIEWESEYFGFSFTPTFFQPLNSVQTISTIRVGNQSLSVNSTPYSERNLKSGFFVQANIFFKF